MDLERRGLWKENPTGRKVDQRPKVHQLKESHAFRTECGGLSLYLSSEIIGRPTYLDIKNKKN